MADGLIPGLDAADVADWLGRTVPGMHGQLLFRRIGAGQSNITALATNAGGDNVVIRRPPVGSRLRSAHDVVREARLLTALAETPVPVPRVLAVDERGGSDGAAVVAMTFVHGAALDGDTVKTFTHDVRHAVGLSLVQTMATIHAVDIDAVGLAGLASQRPYAPRQLKRWAGQWEASRNRSLPALDVLTERLRNATPVQHENRLVHGDLHPANVLVDASTGQVTAALDWELSTLGDPVADLGTLLAYWPEPGEESPMGVSVSATPGFATRAELVTEYARVSGRDVATVPFWHALGLWKIAIICEGVLRRVRDDPRNGVRGWVPDVHTVDAMIRRAADVATANGF